MPISANVPLRERKQGSPCVFPGCHFVSIGRDIEEMKYDMEMHVRDKHYRDSRANQLMAMRGLSNTLFPPPGYKPPVVYRQPPVARKVA